MKKLILLVCFVFASSVAFSQFNIENFDYTAGTNITANGWSAISGAGTNPIKVASSGLTFPQYSGSGIGLSAAIQSLGGEDDEKALNSVMTSGSLYMSFMLSVSSTPGTGDYFFAVRSVPSGNLNARVYAKTATGGYNLGIGNTGSVATYAADVFSFNVTYLVIVQYEFVTAAPDLLSLWVFSTAAPNVPPTPLIGPFTPASMTDAPDLTSIVLRQGSNGNSPNCLVDGISGSTDWDNGVLPVELSSFSSTINKRDVTLNWATSSESNNSGFAIERSSVNNEWTNIGNVAGHGTVNTPNSYSFTDRGLATGTYNYRLKQIDYNGNFEYFNLNNEVNIGIPSKYELSQNYPNPFNPTTNINFDLPFEGNVSIKLFDMSGKEVATLVNESRTAGYHTVNFNASSLSSGVYFYSIDANNFTATKKMMLLK